MSGRRSHSRYVVATPWGGALRVLHDVVIDRAGPDALLAVCHAPGVRGEDLSLELIGDARTLALTVRVLGSRPLFVDGSLRHRVDLALLEPDRQQAPPIHAAAAARERHDESESRELLDAILAAPDRAAVLGRVVPMRVVDISVSGCLMESPRRLDRDTAGGLCILVDGEQYADDIRVVRVGSGRPNGLHQVGVQFLWTSSPGEHSLRRVVAKLHAAAQRPPALPPVAPGLASGSPGTVLPISKSEACKPLRNPSKP